MKLTTNRELLENLIYGDSNQEIDENTASEFPKGQDVYVVFRSKEGVAQLICSFGDVMDADNTKITMNNRKDGWDYFYLPSDFVYGNILKDLK